MQIETNQHATLIIAAARRQSRWISLFNFALYLSTLPVTALVVGVAVYFETAQPVLSLAITLALLRSVDIQDLNEFTFAVVRRLARVMLPLMKFPKKETISNGADLMAPPTDKQ